MKTKKTSFYLEAFGEEVFEGYTFGHNWNGFECPAFEKEVGMKIVESWNKLDKEFILSVLTDGPGEKKENKCIRKCLFNTSLFFHPGMSLQEKKQSSSTLLFPNTSISFSLSLTLIHACTFTNVSSACSPDSAWYTPPS